MIRVNYRVMMHCMARTMPSQDVCLSVRLSHAGILSKRFNIIKPFSPSGRHTILAFAAPNMAIFRRWPANAGVEWVYEKIAIFDQYVAISQKWYKIWS